jgi:hypothetical protein
MAKTLSIAVSMSLKNVASFHGLAPIAGVAAYFLGIGIQGCRFRASRSLSRMQRPIPAIWSYGHAGVGTIQHLTGEAQATRIAVAEPPYKQMLIEAGMEAPLDSNPEEVAESLQAKRQKFPFSWRRLAEIGSITTER